MDYDPQTDLSSEAIEVTEVIEATGVLVLVRVRLHVRALVDLNLDQSVLLVNYNHTVASTKRFSSDGDLQFR
jgi:hypothetical protein